MKPLTLKNILDNLLNVITSDSLLKVNKRINKRDTSFDEEFVKMQDALEGHFLVLPKGLELQSKKELMQFFRLIKKSELYDFEANYVIQDYLEQFGFFDLVWNLLDEREEYYNYDFSEILNNQQLQELKQHKVSNSSIKTKGYWFWRFYFECICMKKKVKIYRIYCKEWGNRFWMK